MKKLKVIAIILTSLVLFSNQTVYANVINEADYSTDQSVLQPVNSLNSTTTANLNLSEGYTYQCTIKPNNLMSIMSTLYSHTVTHTIRNSSGSVVWQLEQVTSWSIDIGHSVTWAGAHSTVSVYSPYTQTTGSSSCFNGSTYSKFSERHTIWDGNGALIADGYFYTMCTYYNVVSSGRE